ncbi:MAG: hypothetical protein Kow0063_25130 [Anaerolineae bacterium]
MTTKVNIHAEITNQIFAIGQAIQQHITESPRRVYQLIVEAACKLTGADCAVLYPYHPFFSEFYDIENVASYGLSHKLSIERKTDKRRRLSARVHRQGEIIREDIEREEPQMPNESSFIQREGIRAFMGLSLRVSDDILGILYVDYRRPHSFSEEEKYIIRLLGQQAAIAVSNSWQARLAGMRADTVARLKAVGQALVALEDPAQTLDSVLEGIVHSAQEVLGADIVDLYQYIQARNEFILPPTLVGERWHPHVPKVRIYDDDVVVRAVRIGKPEYFEDAQSMALLTGRYEVPREDAPEQRFVVREGIVSSAIVPLVAANETVGVLFVNYRTSQLFGTEQKDVIESFAAQAAIAIRNARLFQLEQRRNRDLNALNQSALKMSQMLDTELAYQAILDAVIDTLKCDYCTIFLAGADNVLVSHLSGGRLFVEPPKLRFAPGEGLAGYVYQKGESLVVYNAAEDPRYKAGLLEKDIRPRSMLLSPLRQGNRIIGVVSADIERAGAFDQDDLRLLDTLTLHASTILQNIQFFKDFQILHNAASDLARQSTLEQIYQTAVQAALQTLHCNHSTIFILDKRAGELVAMERAGSPRPASEVRRFKVGEGLAGAVAETGTSLLVNDAARDERFVEGGFAPRSAPRSIVLAPIKIEDKIIGVISADKDEVGGFTGHNLEILEMLALDVGIAIEKQRRVEALSILNNIGQELTSGVRLKEDQILELICEQTYRLTGTQEMYVALYEKETGTIRFGPAMEKGQRVRIEPRQANMERRGKTEEVIFTKKPLLHRTRQEAEDWYGLPGHQEFRGQIAPSWMGVPMMIGGEVLGMIAVYDWEREYAYDELDLHVLSSMASQAAIVLDNASLLRDVREELIATRQLAALGTATAAIQHRINNTLNIIGPNIARLRKRVDTSDATIQEILDIIERNTRYTSDYIARIQEPLKETEIQLVDINLCLRDAQARVWGEYQGRTEFGPVKIVYDLDDALPPIKASLAQVTEIFRNLIENSYKAMGAEGGCLTITSRRAGDRLEVEVRDTGPGIPANILDRLFIKPVPSRKPGEGAGLGLWLSNLLIQRYAGEISVAETGPEGTTMLVSLPVSRL